MGTPPRSVPFLIPAILVMASAIGILSTDLYVPSLPDLVNIFSTTAERVQLTMTVNLAAYSLAQLVYGPLADRYGRRPVLLISLCAFAVVSLAATAVGSINGLIAVRALQGATAAAEAVVVLAVISDLYKGDSGIKVLAMYGMVIAVVPAVGPAIGGFVHVTVGWWANFVLLFGLAAVAAVVIWRLLPETGTPDPTALRPRRVLAAYAALLRHKAFMTYAGATGAAMGGLFGFITAAPFVLIERLGVPTIAYGLYQAAIVAAFFFGSLAASRMAGRLGAQRILQMGLAILCLGGLLLPAIIVAGLESPVGVTLGLVVFGFGLGLLFASAPILALSAVPASAGAAAALLGTLEMAGGAIGSVVVLALHDGTAWPLATVVATSGVAASAIYLGAGPWRATVSVSAP